MNVTESRIGYVCDTCGLVSSFMLDNRTDDDWDTWYAGMLEAVHADHLSNTPDCPGVETNLRIGLNPDE